MARERISEYTAKRMLLGDTYTGTQMHGGSDKKFDEIAEGAYVAKVDQGVKKRFLQGLVAVNVSKKEAVEAIQKWETLGYTQFLLEQFVPHEKDAEHYLSFDRVREGIRVLWVDKGGVEVESDTSTSHTFLLSDQASVQTLITKGIPQTFIDKVESLMMNEYVSFIEINPIVITQKGPELLDAAVLVDGAGAFFAHAWSETDIIRERSAHLEVDTVTNLQKSTAASLKLSVMHPDGALFFLLSGGGGSIVALDAVHESGAGAEIGNYGEYSGGPTCGETYLYSKQVLALLLRSKAPKKALVIVGGVANFTDVLQTFAGVIDAITEVAPQMREACIKVFVRRGGPNESAGLHNMEEFLSKEGLLGSIHGSTSLITKAVSEAVTYIK